MSNINCGNCKQQHSTVAEVRACYGLAPAKSGTPSETVSQGRAHEDTIRSTTVHPDPFGETTTQVPPTPATEKQVAFALALQERRPVEDRLNETALRAITKRSLSGLIDQWVRLPKTTTTGTVTAKREIEDGIWYVEDTNEIYKVYVTVHGNRQQCVKRLEHIEGTGKGKFAYLGLAAKHLPKAARLMTLEEAKKFGRLYGFCVKCGRTLTDEQSIADGIGPVCGADGKWGTADTSVQV